MGTNGKIVFKSFFEIGDKRVSEIIIISLHYNKMTEIFSKIDKIRQSGKNHFIINTGLLFRGSRKCGSFWPGLPGIFLHLGKR